MRVAVIFIGHSDSVPQGPKPGKPAEGGVPEEKPEPGELKELTCSASMVYSCPGAEGWSNPATPQFPIAGAPEVTGNIITYDLPEEELAEKGYPKNHSVTIINEAFAAAITPTIGCLNRTQRSKDILSVV